FTNLSGHHVVQKDDIDTVDLNKSPRLLQIVSLHFDADVGPFVAKQPNLIGKPGEAPKGGEVIVLYENHVVQPGTGINATSGHNCGLFQCAQPGSCFACIEYLSRMISNRVNELAGERCDAAEALKKI